MPDTSCFRRNKARGRNKIGDESCYLMRYFYFFSLGETSRLFIVPGAPDGHIFIVYHPMVIYLLFRVYCSGSTRRLNREFDF